MAEQSRFHWLTDQARAFIDPHYKLALEFKKLTPQQQQQYLQANPTLTQWFNAPVDAGTGGKPKAKATSAKTQTTGLFETPTPVAAPVNNSMPTATAAPGVPTAQELVSSMVPGATFTSTDRTPADQARLKKQGYNPAQNSQHLQAGHAADFVPPKGADPNAIVQQLTADGMWAYYDPKRGHIHADTRNFYQAASPTVRAGDPTDAGQVFSVTPQAAMGMIPNPRMIPGVDLPNAPQQALPAPMPDLAPLDKEALLSPFDDPRLQPTAPDTKFDNWQRVATGLAQAAMSASRMGPGTPMGQLLLAAGGGFGGGFQQQLQEQEAEQRQYDELVRAMLLSRTNKGLDIDLDNAKTGRTNQDRQWQSGESVKKVDFENKSATYQNRVQEILQNARITAENVGALNSTDARRGNVGIAALEGTAAAANTANARQIAANAAANSSRGTKDALDNDLRGLGIEPDVGKNPGVINAKQALAAANAKDVGLAMSALARDLVASPHLGSILGDADLKAVEQAVRDKNAEGAAGIVTQALTTNMTKNPQAVLQLIDELATLGVPSAVVISKKRARAPAKTQ